MSKIKVGVFASGGTVRKEFLLKGVDYLKKLGFDVIYNEDIFEKHFFSAGTVNRRVNELISFLLDDDISILWAARGGAGTIDLLPLLDQKNFHVKNKILIGYSDITYLHYFFIKKFNMRTIYAPMVAVDMARDGKVNDKLLQNTIANNRIEYKLTPLTFAGNIKGKLIGGCVSMMESLIGTPWDMEFDNKILFLEDVGMKPYQIARMLYHMKYAGKFNKVKAFIFGEMLNCEPPKGEKDYTLSDIIIDILGEFNVPIYIGFPSGHTKGVNLPLPLNSDVEISGEELIVGL